MPQITFPYEQAHQALQEFLSRAQDGRLVEPGERATRYITGPGTDDVDTVILEARRYNELADAGQRHIRPRDHVEGAAGYAPFVHSPLDSHDRRLPAAPLLEVLARQLHSQPYEELGAEERCRIAATVSRLLARVQLEADDSGAVPILLLAHQAHERESAGPARLWQLAYRTGVHGLYLRGTANALFGEEWAIVTGGGWMLASGWLSRQVADRAVAALGRLLPQVDWMTCQAGDFPPPVCQAVVRLVEHYSRSIVERDYEAEPLDFAPVPVAAEAGAR